MSCVMISASQVALVVKNLHANAGHAGDEDLISVSGRSPRVGNGNPLQSFCLGNRMNRGAMATVHGLQSGMAEHKRVVMTEVLGIFV